MPPAVPASAEERYRALLASLDDGFCLVEVDADGRDFRFLEANPAFEAHTGLRGVVGRTARELVPGQELLWPKHLAAVVASGRPTRFEEHTPTLGRWFDLFASPVGPPELRQVAVLVTDVTAHKRREAHQALLAALSGDFAQLVTAEDILRAVGRRLGAHLELTHVNLADVDDASGTVSVLDDWTADGTPSFARSFRLGDYLSAEFLRASRAGETVVLHDTQADPRADAAAYAALGVGAFITVPFHVAGAWKAYVTVISAGPRTWRDDEVELVREVAHQLFPRLERARAEAALRQSEARYRSLFASMDEGCCVTQGLFDAGGRLVDCRYLEVNPAFERHTGLKGVQGRTFREVNPGVESHWFDVLGEVARTGAPVRFESHSPSVGRWYDVYAFRTGEPHERKVATLFSDVTARRQAEAALREERHKLLSIFQQAPVLICIVEGRELTFTFANPTYLTLMGRQDLVGKRPADVMPAEDAARYGALAEQVMRTGVPYIGKEVPGQFGDHFGYTNFVYQPLKDAEGRVTGVLACGYEVTEQVVARQEAERLRAEAQQRVDFEEKLIGIVGHDLRQPLQAISMSAQVMLARSSLEGRTLASVNRILHSSERAGRMLRDILDFTQARLGGGIPLTRAPADVAEVARTAAEDATVAAAHESQRRVDVSVQGDGHGEFDTDRLRQVLDNLLANALAYGDPHAPVRVAVDGRGEREVVLRVHNAGEPIPAELMPHLFEPMRRGTSLAGKRRSVGLGLFIVQHLVQSHGGSIEVESAQGAGTTFTVRLPRHAAPATGR
jgi:PAS domain S-box-containing protein